MTNLFAFRATEPPDMMKAADPVGDDNILWIGAAARASELIICCWGNDGVFKKQCREVFKAALDWEKPLFHLGLTKEGQPLHPLYLKGSTEPRQFYQEASR